MILWKWKAVGESGRLERGLAKGTDLNKVLAWLRARDLYPVKIRPSVFYTFRVRVASWQALLFWARTTRKIGTFLEAGIPLITVLNILALKEPDPFKKAEWQDVIQKIENGEDLSSALKEFIPAPGIFVEAMIQTGERCGTLSNCLLEAAEQLEEEHFFLRRLKSLLFYPCLLFIVTLVILYVLSLVILPMYKDLFLEFGADLPLLTKILFQLGRGIPYFLASGALFILLNLILSRKRLIFKIPGLKEIEKIKTLQQFCSVFARLFRAGIPLLEAMTLLKQITPRAEISKLIEEIKSAVQEGRRIAPVFEVHSFFPPETAAMLEVAEESGRFGEMLGHLSQMFKRELEEKLQQYPRVLEPLLVIGLAGLVATVAIGVLMPIFDLTTYIR